MTQYTINRLGHLGDGITDGPLYVPQTLPGEVITGTPEGEALRDVKIITPSADRVSPPCRHFRTCGGCLMQHASDGFLARWKGDIAKAALAAHGITVDFLPIAISPPRSRRRATFAARRSKKGAMAGFHAKGSDVIVEVNDCHLLHPDLLAALPVAKDLAIAGASRKHHIDVAVTLSGNGLDVLATEGKPLDGPLRISLGALAEKHRLARLCWGDEIISYRAAPEQVFGISRVTPPPGSFLQATLAGEAALQADVKRIVTGAKNVIDLYAGCGTFALDLATHSTVHAVEGSAEMIAALDAGWRNTQGLKPVTSEVRDLHQNPLLPDELKKYDAVVIDPPRVGAETQIAQVCAAQIPKIAYVSCNPTSFARDARALIDSGYCLETLRVVDQFRWSNHVELVAEFSITSG
ncbi:23S rRNA (uracil(1939)-C(5))-methyltransferase [hydrothermal vent metagenome]|uniref:23S rRNA (Uracil(1939)-C(5))-methyltransferase n=1 Tax=hydrothermal vent metagenome TaxID=652676 RepID=A0A3B0RSF1_9ZZZZ